MVPQYTVNTKSQEFKAFRKQARNEALRLARVKYGIPRDVWLNVDLPTITVNGNVARMTVVVGRSEAHEGLRFQFRIPDHLLVPIHPIMIEEEITK